MLSTCRDNKGRTMTGIDPSRPWRLSHVLEGHSSDVKALNVVHFRSPGTAKHTEVFQSCSRDETTRSWVRSVPAPDDTGDRAPSVWRHKATFQGKRFQNSLAFVDDNPGGERCTGLTMMGGLDARILVYRFGIDVGDDEQSQTEPEQILQDHYDNVCHLSVCDERESSPDSAPLLISASWDCTSRVWRLRPDRKHGSLWTSLHLLKGHEAAVWAAEVVSTTPGAEKYLTASADRFVRLWHGEEAKRIFAGHADVVRGITLLTPRRLAEREGRGTARESYENDDGQVAFFDNEQLFATCSNDGSIRVWSLDDRRCPKNNPTNGGEALRLLSVGDDADLLYDLKSAGSTGKTAERLVIACGEGGSIDVWNVESGKRVSHIPQPVSSAWSVAFLPQSGDVVTADSDARIRVYTQRPSLPEVEQIKDGDGIVEVDEVQLQEHEKACERVKISKQRQVQAKIIATESSESGAGAIQNEYEGQQFDAVLQIDVSDDSEPLSLPINKGDDPREKARAFIAQQKLSERYEDEIVAFIQQVGPK